MPARKKHRSASRPRKAARPRIPAGFHTVTPYLAVENGVAALEFYKRAFGAKELQRQLAPGGKLIHGRIRIGDSMVMLSDVFEGSDRAAPSTVGTSTVSLHIYTTDVETLWNRAVAAGAKETMPLEDQFWGERYGQLVDPFGHRWSLSMPVRMSKAAREAKRREAFAAFSKGDEPDRVPPDTDV